jgi:hypothetical protein
MSGWTQWISVAANGRAATDLFHDLVLPRETSNQESDFPPSSFPESFRVVRKPLPKKRRKASIRSPRHWRRVMPGVIPAPGSFGTPIRCDK